MKISPRASRPQATVLPASAQPHSIKGFAAQWISAAILAVLLSAALAPISHSLQGAPSANALSAQTK